MDKNTEKPEDAVVIHAMLKRFVNHRYPKVLELEKRVLGGEKLYPSDIVFLDMVFNDAQYIIKLADKYPEYQEMVLKAVQLYTDITQKALENEKKN